MLLEPSTHIHDHHQNIGRLDQTIQRPTPEPDEPDWVLAWLIAHVDPDLWTPREPIIVREVTRGSPTLAALWRTIFWLWTFYKPTGQRHFGFRLIARVGGLGRNYIAAGVRELHRLGLLIVHGLDREPDQWEYDFPISDLEARSVALLRERISAGQLVPRRQPTETRQRQLFAALGFTPTEVPNELDPAASEEPWFIAIPVAPQDATVHSTLTLIGAMSANAPALNGATGRSVPLALVGATSTSPVAPFSATPASTATLNGASIQIDASVPDDQLQSVLPMAPIGAMQSEAVAPVGATDQAVSTSPTDETAPNRHLLMPPTPPVALMGAIQTTSTPPVAPIGAVQIMPPPVMAPVGATPPPVMASIGATQHPSVPPQAILDDQILTLGGERERERERKSESEQNTALTHTNLSLSLQTIEVLIERALAQHMPLLIEKLNSQMVAKPNAPFTPISKLSGLLPADVPATPLDEPALPLPLQVIWELVNHQQPAFDTDLVQIRMLISRYETVSGGYGAYWVGRCMLFADLCRNDTTPLKLKLINSYLTRMSGVGFSTTTLEDRHQRADGPTMSPPNKGDRPRSAPSTEPIPDHPAISAYRSAFGRLPNAVQAKQISETVTDPVVWQQVLTDWQANGWKENGVAKMLDRYCKATGAAPAEEATPPHILPIYNHPDLTDEQRDRWIDRFHHALTPAEKHAVLARLHKEHPLSSTQPSQSVTHGESS